MSCGPLALFYTCSEMVDEPALAAAPRFRPLIALALVSSLLSAALALFLLVRLDLSSFNALQIWVHVHAGPLLWLPFPAGFEWYDFAVSLAVSLTLMGIHLLRPRGWTKILGGLGVALWFLTGWTVQIQGY